MTKRVAVDGDTQVETSTAKISADLNQTGSWQLIASHVTTGQKLSVHGKMVELSATAVWQYVGGTAGSPPSAPVPIIVPTDSATLNAGSTKLTDGGRGILLDNDQATGSVDRGNRIRVSASQHILSTD